jgi:fucose permease
LLAACFAVTRKLWLESNGVFQEPESTSATNASPLSTMRVPVVWLGIAVFFVYTGIEAAAGTWAFSLFTEARGVSMMTAGTWVSIYWGSLTAGRLLSGFVAGFVSAHRLLSGSVVGVVLGATLIWLGGATIVSFLGLGLMGLACAPIFPSMIASTPARVGARHTPNAVGFQIAAAVLGQSLLPALIGLMAQRMGLEIIGAALLISAAVLVGLYVSLAASRHGAARELSAVA